MAGATYKDAGVDLDAYRDAMSRLPNLLRRTHSPRVVPNDGGFAGLFQLDFCGELFARRYRDPVLVAGTDGVGTKLKVAQLAGRHDTVGIDLVAMCVNDAICCGAEPLFFLDYVAMSHDDPPKLAAIVEGISNACVTSDMALIGGETAIMPDLYSHGDYDLAGFCVGVVERKRVIDGSAIVPGDVILGVGSAGLHSNGFSLVRKVVFEDAGLCVNDVVPALDSTVADVLLTPTHLYPGVVRSVLTHYRKKLVVHGLAHITGGGMLENVKRILPETVSAVMRKGLWPVPPVFEWLQKLGDIDDDQMYGVFNMGIGMVVIASSFFADSVRHQIAERGYDTYVIGEIVHGDGSAGWN